MLASPFAAELLAGSLDYDAMVLDLQHGVGGPDHVYPLLQALGGADMAKGVVPLVRAASNDPASLGYALDAGARGVIMPLIDSRADAQQFVSACLHYPKGTRSWGPIRSDLMHRLRAERGSGGGGGGGGG